MQQVSLDARDRAILYYLDKDARQSISAIAKKIKLSKEVVNYRIKNLMKEGVLQDFSTIINSSKLGYTLYRVFIRLQQVDGEKEQEIVQHLEKMKSVGWVVLLEEMYDLGLLIWARNVFEFKETYDSLLKMYGKYFQQVLVTLVTQVSQHVHNYLYNTSDLSVRTIGGNCSPVVLDDVDGRILQILSKDARTPLLNIAKAARVSPNTVKHRIKRLVKEGVIVGFKSRINVGLLGYQQYRIFVQLARNDTAIKNKLQEFLRVNKNVVYITEGVGRGDFDFEIFVKQGSELYHHLQELKKHFGAELQDCRTTLIKREHALSYLPCGIENIRTGFASVEKPLAR